MRLRNVNEPPPGSGFSFYFEAPDGAVVSINRANGLVELEREVRAAMKNNGVEAPDELAKIIQHQICLRADDPESLCWSGGIGDDLHHKWVKPFLVKVADVVKGGIISSLARALSSCGGCSGTRVYKPGENALGRAETINKAGRSVKSALRKLKIPKL